MKKALVLSGGGSRGAFEVGAIDYLVTHCGEDFEIFLGTSAGALNVAILGSARNHHELTEQTRILKQLWLDIKGNDSIYRRNFGGIFNLLFRGALYNPTGLKQLLTQAVDPFKLCHNPAKFIKVATVALETGELFFADSRRPEHRDQMLDYILASASIPLFFPPVIINGKHWYDGGLRDMTPLGAAFKEKPDEIVVILTFPINAKLQPVLEKTTYRGVFHALLRSLNILTNEISANDLQLANFMNQYYRLFPGIRRVAIRIIAPEKPLAGDLMEFNPKAIQSNLQAGYEAARKSLFNNSHHRLAKGIPPA